MSSTYLAHHELKSDFVIFLIIIIMSCHLMASCHVAEECACTQGDEEAKLQLPVTPMCDRRSVIVSTNQLRFIQFLLKVVHDSCCTACMANSLNQYGFVEWNIFCMSTLFAMKCSVLPVFCVALYEHDAHQSECICRMIAPLSECL